ncbi:TetR/AcrR family transcriptional regulator [Lysinibacter sp. HNR]|uniref:TetR/AcrR family transcriptional regulator n=1 Tax=Lysinibacter sp. HNR TaxID=3031408 RepID=UPI0024349F61|nr:TetR/AcrR family transcriptional regulator [Lysinibacter sp. HNR]WGD37898.1 TetR/AcrR family transcriptional regulator [Lysinibacter sp. HNR]
MTRDRILLIATRHFANAGLSGASLREIASEVGIKAPSIYTHFASKEELFAEVYTAAVAEHRRFFVDLLQRTAQLTPMERLFQLLVGVPTFYTDRPELIDFHLRAVADGGPVWDPKLRTPFRAEESDLLTNIRDTYVEGRNRGSFVDLNPDTFASHFLCLMDGLFLQLKHYPPDLYDERLNSTWSFVTSALSVNSGPTERYHDDN